MKIGNVSLASPYAIAPMAGMTDTAFRRLVKRQGGCGLVVTEMVSAEGLVRGIDRTLEYAEYTEEERPVSIRIFGGDPGTMADAARIVQDLGADIVDVNMGCPVPKIARHNAGCSLMREPEHAASVIAAMARAVSIPVTVKMRAGWNEREVNAPTLARMAADAGAAAVAVHGRTAAQSYSGIVRLEPDRRGRGGRRDPRARQRRLRRARPDHRAARDHARERRARRTRRAAKPVDSGAGAGPRGGPRAPCGRLSEERGRVPARVHGPAALRARGEADGFRHIAGSDRAAAETRTARGRERWVINKVRALGTWYTKGFENGSHLRVAINRCESLTALRETIGAFFFEGRTVFAA